MKKIQVLILIIASSSMLFPMLSSCQRIDPARNKIVFNDKFDVVQDSLIKMQSLLKKLPKTFRINYFVDPQAYLYVNNTKLGLLRGAINNPRIRKDMSFENFSDEEYRSFFLLMSFLANNYIKSASFEPSVKSFVFYYRETEERRYVDLRNIVVDSDKNFDKLIKGSYQILDQAGRLKLLAGHDVKIR
jgi:hypothetical protein